MGCAAVEARGLWLLSEVVDPGRAGSSAPLEGCGAAGRPVGCRLVVLGSHPEQAPAPQPKAQSRTPRANAIHGRTTPRRVAERMGNAACVDGVLGLAREGGRSSRGVVAVRTGPWPMVGLAREKKYSSGPGRWERRKPAARRCREGVIRGCKLGRRDRAGQSRGRVAADGAGAHHARPLCTELSRFLPGVKSRTMVR